MENPTAYRFLLKTNSKEGYKMNNKDIHVVFQVLNFLRNSDVIEYKLLPADKLLLIFLASHFGTQGIFPNQSTLAKEMQCSIRHVRARLKYLQEINLISINCIKRKHHYSLLFLSTEGPPLSTEEEVQFPYKEPVNHPIEEPQFPSQRNHSSSQSGTTVPTNRYNNNQLNKIERSAKRSTSLPINFKPDEESVQLGQSLGLSDEIVFKFRDYCLSKASRSYDWQSTFRNFMRSEAEYRKRNQKNEIVSEVRPILPLRESSPVQRNFYTAEQVARHREVGQAAVKDILKFLGMNSMNGKGGHVNGKGLASGMAQGGGAKA